MKRWRMNLEVVPDPVLASTRSKIAGQVSAGHVIGHSSVCDMVVCIVRVCGDAQWYRLGDMVMCLVQVRGEIVLLAHLHDSRWTSYCRGAQTRTGEICQVEVMLTAVSPS